MKRIGLAVLAAAGFTMAVARPVAAQSGTTLGVGVGLTLPMSDYGDKAVLGDKMGFHFGVGAGLALGSAPVRLRVEGSYTQTSHQEGVDGNTKLIGGMVSLVYPFSTAGSINRLRRRRWHSFSDELDEPVRGSALSNAEGVRRHVRAASDYGGRPVPAGWQEVSSAAR